MLCTHAKKRDKALRLIPPRGFTLIELMVTIAVGAIMLALALPAFDDFVRNNRRASAVNEFTAAANLARAEALRRARTISLCRTEFTPNAGNCSDGSGWHDGWVVYEDTNDDGDYDAGEEIKFFQGLGGDITIDGNTNVDVSFGFRASGELAGNVGTWVFCDSRGYNVNYVRELTITQTGRLRVKDLLPPTSESGLGTCTP